MTDRGFKESVVFCSVVFYSKFKNFMLYFSVYKVQLALNVELKNT